MLDLAWWLYKRGLEGFCRLLQAAIGRLRTVPDHWMPQKDQRTLRAAKPYPAGIIYNSKKTIPVLDLETLFDASRGRPSVLLQVI